MFETEEQKERIILVAVATADGDDTEQSLDELEELGQTAGAVTVAKVIQNREKVANVRIKSDKQKNELAIQIFQ